MAEWHCVCRCLSGAWDFIFKFRATFLRSYVRLLQFFNNSVASSLLEIMIEESQASGILGLSPNIQYTDGTKRKAVYLYNLLAMEM